MTKKYTLGEAHLNMLLLKDIVVEVLLDCPTVIDFSEEKLRILADQLVKGLVGEERVEFDLAGPQIEVPTAPGVRTPEVYPTPAPMPQFPYIWTSSNADELPNRGG